MLMAVLALWVAMVSVVLGCIAVYGRNVPLAEDWNMVPALTGQEPNLLEWLWAQNNEHRLPLQKAVYLVLLKASGGDFRIGMIANTLMLGGLSLAMILTARRLRGGRTRLADAFFPLALLHLGHWENMVWGWEIQFVISTVLVCVWLLIIVSALWPLPPKIAVTAGLTLVLLPLSGANGLLFTPFVALWFVACMLVHRRDVIPRWIVRFQIACVITSIALIGLYFVGYERPAWVLPNPGFGPTVKTGARFIGMALGPVGAYPGWIAGFACGVVSLLLASSIIPLRLGLRRNRTPERSRVFGLLIFTAAMAALVVAIAWGRAGWMPRFGMPDRYALFSVPALCAVYFVWILYGPEIVSDRIAIAFMIATVVAFPFNLLHGRKWRDWYLAGMQAFEHDLSDGLSWEELADRHHKFLMHWNRDELAERMRMLHEAKTGPLGRATPRERIPP
jgi:hypothetical protein